MAEGPEESSNIETKITNGVESSEASNQDHHQQNEDKVDRNEDGNENGDWSEDDDHEENGDGSEGEYDSDSNSGEDQDESSEGESEDHSGSESDDQDEGIFDTAQGSLKVRCRMDSGVTSLASRITGRTEDEK